MFEDLVSGFLSACEFWTNFHGRGPDRNFESKSAERDGHDNGMLIDRPDDAAHFARAAPWLRFNPPYALRASLAQQLSAARSLRFR